MAEIRSERTDRLFRAILELKDVNECYDLFEDLCTIKELDDMSQRFEVALLLSQGCNYQEINKVSGASTATISRVKRCLDYGTGGYRKALEKK